MQARRRLNHILSHLHANSINGVREIEYVFITGCSRGIGYGLVAHFLKDPRYFVIASCRSPEKANELKSLLSKHSNRSTLIELDTSSEQSIINATKSITKQNLYVDILINNAAIVSTKVPSYKETVINFDNAEMRDVLNINLIGPATIFKYFFNQNIFRLSARVVNITSNVASLTKDTNGEYLSYRISKTGINMLTVLQQMQIGNKNGIKIVCIDPGHVQTKMGMEQSGFDTAPLTVNESCNGIINIVKEMKYNDKYNGKFVKYNVITTRPTKLAKDNPNEIMNKMNKKINENEEYSPFEPKSDLFKKILDYLPHSYIITLKYVNKTFNETIKDYKLFRGYTLVFDCGRRTSFIGGRGQGPMLGRNGQYVMKSHEVQFKDKSKEILIATGYKPLKSQYVKQALMSISQTSINKVQFKSYKITEYIGASLPPSTNVSPLDGGIYDSFCGATANGLGAISEMKGDHPTPTPTQNGMHQNGRNYLNKPPESKSSGARKRFDSALSDYSSTRSSSARPSDSSTINSAIMELSLPSTQHSNNSRSSKRISSAIFHGQDSKDLAFEQLLDILNSAPIESVEIGDECICWSWYSVMAILQHFDKLEHLTVDVGLVKVPSIKTEQKWLDFIGMNYENVPNLKSLRCCDDRLLKLLTSLTLYRNLGKNLTFVEDNIYNNALSTTYERGSLSKNKLRLNAIKTQSSYDTDTDEEDVGNIINGHYIKKTKRDLDTLCALQYIHFQCQFAPGANSLSGVEFEGAQCLEISPYDTMFITIPSSLKSFRINQGKKFQDDFEEYKIIIPFSNNLKELCIHNIENLSHIEGLYHLKHLEYLVIKKKPKDKELFKKQISRLCKYSPIKQIILLFQAKYKKGNRHHHNHQNGYNNYHNNHKNDYWQNLQSMTVKQTKDKMNITDHPNLIMIEHEYIVPPDLSKYVEPSTYALK